MRLKSLLLILSLCLWTSVFAEKKFGPDVKIGGLVQTTAQGSQGSLGYDPVVDVEVTLEGTEYKCMTDSKGYFHFDDIPDGDYTMVFKKKGYPVVRKAVKVDGNPMGTTVSVVMNPGEEGQMIGDTPSGPGTVYVAYGQRKLSQAHGTGGNPYMLDTKRTMQGALAAGADPFQVAGNNPIEMKGMDYQGNPTTTDPNSLMIFPPTAPGKTGFTTLQTAPYWLTFNRKGNVLYVSSEAKMITVLDAAHENRLMRNIPTQGPVTDLQLSADGRYVLAGIMGSTNGIMVIDTNSQDPVALLPTNLPPRAVLMNGPRAFAACGDSTSGHVAVVDSSTGQMLGKIPVGPNPTGMAMTPDGRHIYVVNSGGASVSVLDAMSMGEVAKIPVGVNPQKVAISPDGTRAFVTNKQHDSVSVIDCRSLGVIATPKVGAGPVGVAVSRDSQRAFVTCKEAGTLVMLDGKTGSVMHTTVPPPNSSPWGVAIRP